VSDIAFFHWTELDRTSFAEFRDRILRFEQGGVVPHEARSYAGFPSIALDRVRPRLIGSLDRVLVARRCHRALGTGLPDRRALSRILRFAHGVHANRARGPVPSAGGLQALELYLVPLSAGWLEPGAYHYDRAGHHLSRVSEGEGRDEWATRVPSMAQFAGASLLWIVVGDGRRVERKYGGRGFRFLLLEAGHLMQNLCLLSESLGWCTIPLGGFLEQDVARALSLPSGDLVLYLGACGRPEPGTEGGE